VKPLPITFAKHPGLALGYDAADLLEAGAVAGRLRPFAFMSLGPPPRAVRADERPKGIPSGHHHTALVERLREELGRRGIAPDAADGWRKTSNGKLVTVSILDLARDIWFDLLDDDGISCDHVTRVLLAMTRRDAEVRRKELLARMTGRPATKPGREALAAWVTAVTGRQDPTDVKVMAHWLWLVKRLASDQRPEHELMPIVYGAQGSGKSTATERLVAPWHELASTVDASCLTDDRRYRQLGVWLVGRWEEMQGAGRAEIEKLKHTVTAPTLVYRELNTHSTVTLRRTCSFIGTSNNTVDTMVSDTTGARRFYQLTTPARCDHEAINRIDPSLIWDAVSEDQVAPIGDAIVVVREAQADLVHRDAVSMWLENEPWTRLVVNRVDSTEPLTVAAYAIADGEPFEDIAARFKHWCNQVGQSGIGTVMLAKRLKQEGFTTSRPRGGSTRARKYHRPGERSETSPSAPALIDPTPPAGDESTKQPRGVRLSAKPSDGEDLHGDGAYAFD